MGQRNRSVDLEMEQQQQHHHQSQPSLQPGPCLLLGSFPQPVNNNIPAMVPNSLQDNSAMFYGLPQYHHHQPAPTNYYAPPYVAFQPPPSQLPSSSSHERNAHFVDHTPGAYKRKNAEGIPLNPLLAAPFNNAPEAVAPFGSVRSRPVAVMNPVLPPPPPPHAPQAPNGFIQGNYAGHHPYPPPGSIWYDQHLGIPDGSPSFWPHSPYMQGSNIVAGSVESSIRNPAPFMCPPPQLNPRDHYYHPPPPPVQGVRGQSAALYPPMASSPSYRVPFGNFAPQNIINSGPEMGSVQPTGLRIYQHPPPLAALRQHRGGVPRLRVMPDDEVAMLEFGDFLGNNHIDHHRDMRLDIEEMSYEELLALSERIGTVNTGLPEEDVKNHLKTRTCSVINHAEKSPQTKDGETEPCTICQECFKNEEKIATLDCGHEYHAECLEKWLIVKNVCPICKSEALVMEKGNV
ncbi:extensin [Raphanus sativus]|uniref:RING-type E3 ubiquitin transferase n=1 Tax=Raphanus sativus TaxID=3726 RepID=A0A6J0MC61_RAPSA|nr:extensin [Raphanus sativus]